MLTAISVIVVLGLLIFFHELGHFAVAKMVNIKVYEFSLGFGPKVFGIKRGETAYNLRLFPLGGFVKMAGMDDVEDEEMAKKEALEALGEDGAKVHAEEGIESNPYFDSDRGFNKKTVWQRMAVIFAGPLMNFVLAAVLFAGVAMSMGDPEATTRIGNVLPHKPAAQVGLQPGDLVVAINGEKIDRWGELVKLIEAHGKKELTLTVKRDEEVKNIKVTPVTEPETKRSIIGIEPTKPGFFRGAVLGVLYTAKVTGFIVDQVGQIITAKAPSEGIGGPVRITMEIGKAAQHGILMLAQMTAVLSINLGLFNLFPIPALDGSRLLFLLWEVLRGRPVDPTRENMIHLVGFGLLLLLMVVITYNDIRTQIF
ncbi:MAG: RIP metalloprotease RseP [Clostridia bacterium]|nr:RIP metalloprotease RseP [Clostridia bacterium]